MYQIQSKVKKQNQCTSQSLVCNVASVSDIEPQEFPNQGRQASNEESIYKRRSLGLYGSIAQNLIDFRVTSLQQDIQQATKKDDDNDDRARGRPPPGDNNNAFQDHDKVVATIFGGLTVVEDRRDKKLIAC